MGGMLAVLFVVSGYGCYHGAAFSQYNPRILLAGFTIFGRVPRQSCSPVLAVITFISFGIFCFLPLMLDLCVVFVLFLCCSLVLCEMTVSNRQIYEELANEMEGEHK